MNKLVPRPKNSIGILAVTAPGAVMCYEEIIKAFPAGDNPTVVMVHPEFKRLHAAFEVQDYEGEVTKIVLETLSQLKAAGATFAVMPSNTPHFAMPAILKHELPIPLLDLTEVVIEHIKQQHYRRVLVLGTVWTMHGGLYREKFAKANIEHVVPNDKDQAEVQRLILDYFIPMKNIEAGQKQLLDIVARYQDAADAIALACTELPMVLNEHNCGKPVIDTTRILGKAAAALCKTQS